MISVDILGSCVTRDAFNFQENEYKINNYFARSSLASIYSKPQNISMEDIQLSSAFQKKMVFYDLNKSFRNYLNSIESDILIIDFVDERINILRTSGGRYITRSSEFIRSNLSKAFKTGSVTKEDKEKLWIEGANQLIKDINLNYSPSKIVLHKAFWKEKYLDKFGEYQIFNSDQQQLINENNTQLKLYYDYLKNHLSGIHVIQIDNYFASENHRWGLEPFHYEDKYYCSFLEQLNKISKI